MSQSSSSPIPPTALPPGARSPRHLYTHIPFCPSKCDYCGFVTRIGSLQLVPRYIDAVVLEAQQLAELRAPQSLDTVYFGGGTPSLLSSRQVSRLLESYAACFGLGREVEITLEAHPATITAARLLEFRRCGVNRISFGIESLDAEELPALGRRYSPDVALRALSAARQARFQSVAADLIYGVPGQTSDSWERTLRTAVATGVDHLSLYPLSIEPATVFARRLRERPFDLPGDDAVVEMYRVACQVLAEERYEHYEVASWCRAGHRSRHNMAYWRNEQFYGLGVGAHGYLHPYRTENVRSTTRYIEALHDGNPAVLRADYIDEDTSARETIMLRLRLLQEGLDLQELKQRYHIDLVRSHGSDLEGLIKAGFVRVEGTRLLLAETAVPVANEIWGRLSA